MLWTNQIKSAGTPKQQRYLEICSHIIPQNYVRAYPDDGEHKDLPHYTRRAYTSWVDCTRVLSISAEKVEGLKIQNTERIAQISL